MLVNECVVNRIDSTEPMSHYDAFMTQDSDNRQILFIKLHQDNSKMIYLKIYDTGVFDVKVIDSCISFNNYLGGDYLAYNMVKIYPIDKTSICFNNVSYKESVSNNT